jgi:hypothetical protein
LISKLGSTFRSGFVKQMFCQLCILAECYATLRVFIEKNLKKKIAKKNFRKFSVKFFFLIFFGYPGSTANLGYACEHLGGLGTLVWEEIENAQTVHKA